MPPPPPPPPTPRRTISQPSAAAAAAGRTARTGLRRPGVFAVAFAAVIIVGSLTGAQLKQDKQKDETIKQFRAIDPMEQIKTLEGQRKVLMEQKGELQRKIDAFREKVAEREQGVKRSS